MYAQTRNTFSPYLVHSCHTWSLGTELSPLQSGSSALLSSVESHRAITGCTQILCTGMAQLGMDIHIYCITVYKQLPPSLHPIRYIRELSGNMECPTIRLSYAPPPHLASTSNTARPFPPLTMATQLVHNPILKGMAWCVLTYVRSSRGQLSVINLNCYLN